MIDWYLGTMGFSYKDWVGPFYPADVGARDFLYIRFIGDHLRFIRHDSEQLDVTPQLRWWWENIQPHIDHVSDVYGFFNNDYAGFGAGTCNRLKSMLGFEVKPLIYPKQERLS